MAVPVPLVPRARRSLAFLGFPLAVFAVWRASHAAAVLAFGGDLRTATYAFDGGFYLSILREGYRRPAGGYDEFSNLPFFPGVAWLSEPVALVLRDDLLATALVANGLALACFVTVFGAAGSWTGPAVARRVTVGLALVPSSYHLWMYYSDALLVAASAGAVWCARRRRHRAAAALLVLAATARVVGVVVGPALAAARVLRLRRVDATAVLYGASSATGLVVVMVHQWVVVGDPLAFSAAQEAWGRGLAPPWTPFLTGVGTVVEALPGLAEGVLLDLLVAALVGVLVLALALGARAGRWPAEAFTLAVLTWLVPLFSALVSSQTRFALASWPVLLVPAVRWARWGRALRVPVVLVCVGLSLVLLRRLAQGVFTG